MKNAKSTLPQFQGLLRLIRAEGKFGGTLLQFPATYQCTADNEDYLRWLLESLAETRVVVEFRHARWLTDRTMECLRQMNAGYCIVDLPQVRNLPSSRIEVTSDVACVRFHGLNAPKWEGKASGNELYDYDYSENEIKSWVPVIAKLSKDVKETYVYFNNHYRGKAAKNARTLEGF